MSNKSDAVEFRLGELLQADERLHAYILIDPMLREPLDAQLLKDCGAIIQHIPVHHSSLRDDQRPRLIALRPQATELLDASLWAAQNEQASPDDEAEAGFAIGGWLLSSAGIDEVARHLARTLGACAIPGVGRRYVRFADRRVFEWLWSLLGDVQRAAVLGPIASWITLDRCHRRIQYTHNQAEAHGRAASSLLLTTVQWARLQQCELLQMMLRGWRQFSDILPADYLVQAAQTIAAAQTLGLSNQRDILLLGAYQLQLHPQLCTHPQVIAAVAKTTREGMPLHAALESIPDPDGWDAIRQQLEHMGKSARLNVQVSV